ncbi:outer membrane receptor protein involved in Fe transport [Pontibacter aydingkolensis]|uniref:TonB-dependent receptor n=1 Tax=Pontibacter aydingkolensis TaxID=1911536 RepID=A0ABS7CT51_9BACT|nr:outer membrane beta-barrel family protein [Pontibacter aydingkolensis]MBW7466677.1 TonB-dependent receptor [Pontibacter aydingkolensis]
MKKVYFLFSLLLLYSTTLLAQSEGFLTGVVLDEKQQPAGFVNVAVLELVTAKVVTGAIADMDGHFLIKTPAAGKYQLKISGLGYTEFKTPAFEVTGANFAKDFGKLQVKSDTKVLAEVQVQTMRPTVIMEPDKMVVNVEGTALASGATAYEVLEKSPGVWVDQDGNLQLNGKAGVQVMINGKRSFLSGRELQNLLQGMSAENIKNLEIISNPSSKHDAEGASGIININLKKAQVAGMSGSAYAGYQYNRLSTYTTGGEIHHKSGKWNTSANIDFTRRMWFRDAELDRVFVNENGSKSKYDQTAFEKSERVYPAIRVGTDYDLNGRHSIGVMARINAGENNTRFNSDSYLLNGNDLFIQAKNRTVDTHNGGTYNLHYVGKLDTLGTTLSADLDYVRISSETNSKMNNNSERVNQSQPADIELLQSDNPVAYSIYAAKVDFTKMMGKTKIETGAKASYVKSDNELKFFEIADGQRVTDPKRSNHFIYEENIFAAYANVSATLSKSLTMQAGLRAEQTISTGLLVTKNEKENRDYLELFPSIFLQQKVNDNYQIGYKYSRRINRPNYQTLNPFIFYLDPYTYVKGNPDLKPQYVNSVEVTQTYKQRYNLILGYANTKDFMAEIPEQNPEDNTTIFQQQNVKDLKSATATMVAPITISNKWQVNNNIMTMYQEYTTISKDEVIVNDKITAIIQSNHSIMLPKNFKLEVNGGYQSPAVFGLYQIEDQWWVDAGLKYSMLDDKLTFGLNLTDIFKGREMQIQTNLNGNVNAIDQYQGTRSVRLNLRYRFNKGTKFEAKKRNVNLEELNRTGN